MNCSSTIEDTSEKETTVRTEVMTRHGHQFELVDLLESTWSKLYNATQNEAITALTSNTLTNISGEFALASFATDEQGRMVLHAARTIGIPARVACQILSPTHTRFFIAHTIEEIRQSWVKGIPSESRRQKPFDPDYTEMVPAFLRLTIKPWLMRDRKYLWFLPGTAYAACDDPLEPSIPTIGKAYVTATLSVLRDQLRLIPDDTPLGLALSGGADSTLVAAGLLVVLQELHRTNPVYFFTLAVDGGGSDLPQAEQVVSALRRHFGRNTMSHVPIKIHSAEIDVHQLQRDAALCLEEYHIRDVECAMAGLLLYRGVQRLVARGTVPSINHDFNGDGGNEVFRDYPLWDEGYGNINFKDVLSQPFLYLLGYDRKKLMFNPSFSAGLSRSYTRTFNPARAFGVQTFSPLIDRRVIEVGRRIPLSTLAPTPQELHTLRGEAVRAGLEHVLNLRLPVFPKVRFQEGCSADPRLLRVSQDDSLRLKAMVLSRAGQ